MFENIDHISINDTFWIHIRKNLTSFGLPSISDDIHFTLSYHPESADVNLHLSKNIKGQGDKPRITIFRINNDQFEVIADRTAKFLHRKMLQPLNMKALKRRNRKRILYLPLSELHKTEVGVLFRDLFTETFGDVPIVKKTHLKYEKDICKRFERLRSEEKSVELATCFLKNLTRVPKKHSVRVEAGAILLKNKLVNVIRIDNNWFGVKQLKIEDVISFATPGLFRHMRLEVKRAVVALRNANNFGDVKDYNREFYIVPFKNNC